MNRLCSEFCESMGFFFISADGAAKIGLSEVFEQARE